MTLVQAFVLLCIMFLSAVVILRRLMTRHITTATTRLQALSQDYVRKQEEFKTRLEESERHYQDQIAKAQEEAHQLKAQMVKEAERSRDELIEHARQEAERIVQQATQAREVMRQELEQSLEERAVARACQLLQEALPDALRQATHTQWVDALLKDGLLSVQQLTTQEPAGPARVVSAFEMTAAQHRALLERLRAALGAEVTLEVSVDERLVAGLVITIGHVVMDGSLASKLREAARHAHHSAQ